MMYRAAAALPYDDRARAAAGLRGQLRVMAGIDGAEPDWSTFAVEGPVPVLETLGRVWFEWTATVTGETKSDRGHRAPTAGEDHAAVDGRDGTGSLAAAEG